MDEDLQAAYSQLGVVARNTVRTLARVVARRMRGSEEHEAALAAALEHLAEVREGFQLTLRAGSIPSAAEMQYVVEQALIDWRWWEKLNWQLSLPKQVELPHNQPMAFTHAYVSLALLPRLPEERITFPQTRRSYADIPVPAPGAELALRLEELERVIYRVLGGASERLERQALRRTYGYFEASAWLVATHRERFAPM